MLGMNSNNLEQLKARRVAVLAPGEATVKKKLNKRTYGHSIHVCKGDSWETWERCAVVKNLVGKSLCAMQGCEGERGGVGKEAVQY